MPTLLDQAFFLFHSLLIGFDMFGWIARRTRAPHRVLMGLTAFSWFGLGAFRGWGYCLCTDWHFQVRRQLGHHDVESSYMQLLFHKVFGLQIDRPLSNFLGMSDFLMIVMAMTFAWVRDWRRARAPASAWTHAIKDPRLMENDRMRSESPNAFPTTCWGRVARAADPDHPDARAALAELCQTYWYPIYAFIRRRRHDPDEALDLTQDYFARLLEKRVLGSADQGKGSFRAFLRTDCGFFLSHQYQRDRALKRGGGAIHLAIDGRDAEGRYLHEPADTMTPERLFDRTWALGLLDDVLKQLAREHNETGRADQFAALQGALDRSPRSDSYAALADRLGTTEGAVQQTVKRLRKRYKAVLRERIAATLDRPDEAAIDDEIRDLFAALAD